MFNINSQGILKDVVKTDLKVFNISNFNFIETVSTDCIQILTLETHKRLRKTWIEKYRLLQNFCAPPCTEANTMLICFTPFQYL